MPRAQKGERFGGRKRGTPNKLPRNLKDKAVAILEQLESEGKGLADLASDDPKWFCEHFIKPMMPKNIDITGDINHTHSISDSLKAALDAVYQQGSGA